MADAGPSRTPTTTPTRHLPEIRADLTFSDGPRDAEGRIGLMIFDPLRNAHFRLAHPASRVLRSWRAGDAESFRAELATRHGLTVSDAELAEIVEFLHASELTLADRNDSWREIAQRQVAAKPGLALALAHNYLFFRIPLVAPDRLLGRLLPLARLTTGRGFLAAYGLGLLVAAFLILRRFDAFAADTAAAMTTGSLPAYAALLFALKCVHELGHALVARHHGCRVPTMGIAFMLGVPMLYTDTTDAWRLTDRRRRLAVVLAGVGAETLVAGLALFAWSFLPEGGPRQMACALAVLSLVTSLALNLNPCMRFDGYFALSDLLDVPNLQDRAFALTRSHLRHALLGLPQATAPDLSPLKSGLLVVWGYATWLYRAVLYTGIAAIVYMMSFKLLGILLLAFEVGWFLVRPLARELSLWWSLRADLLQRRRARLSLGLAAALLVLAVLPWNRVVEAPALRMARHETPLHATTPARIVEVLATDGAEVEEGRLLFRLEAPAIEAQRRRAEAEIRALETRLSRAPALAGERDSVPVLTSQLAAAREKLAGLRRLDADLEIRAPIGGVLVDLDPGLAPGVWINSGQELARVVAPAGVGVHALVDEADVRRLRTGATAVFVSETGIGRNTPLRVVALGESSERRLADPALADVHGGPVATAEASDGLTPRASLFAVTLEGDAAAPLLLERGTVRIAAAGEAPLTGTLRRVAQVLTRESGF